MSVEVDESKIAQIALLIAQTSAVSYRDALEALADFERLRTRAEKAEARLAKVEALCAAADEGYGAGIYGTEVRAAELRAILKETP